jgi:hypothetical protein
MEGDRPVGQSRREFLLRAASAGAALALTGPSAGAQAPAEATEEEAPLPVPVIDTTDLYHPHQDVGDNVDIVAAYGLPEVDLRAVILDVTERYRNPATGDGVARDPGIIPVCQLNYVFERDVPYGMSPFEPMVSPEDSMLRAPAHQQSGVKLLLETLQASPRPVDITVFGSARTVAVALNREPALMRAKTHCIHLCAGSSDPAFTEWNVALDPDAVRRMLSSNLPVAIYPCGTAEGAFAYGPHNSFWLLPNLEFVRDMHPKLRSYLAFAFERSARADFLRAMDEPPTAEVLSGFLGKPHNVWETAVWAVIARRAIASRDGGPFRLMPRSEVRPTDRVLPNDLRPCTVQVRPDGNFTFRLTDEPTPYRIYWRGDPKENEAALRDALPDLYRSFIP